MDLKNSTLLRLRAAQDSISLARKLLEAMAALDSYSKSYYLEITKLLDQLVDIGGDRKKIAVRKAKINAPEDLLDKTWRRYIQPEVDEAQARLMR